MSARSLTLTALLIVISASAAAGAADAPAGAVTAGKQLVDTNGCATCHQSGGLAPALSTFSGKPASELEAALLDPQKAFGPSTTMPSYKDKLSASEVAAIVAFIKAQH